jgi:teichoic acid transport system permease protein
VIERPDQPETGDTAEPALLGASATLPVQRKRRTRTSGGRRARARANGHTRAGPPGPGGGASEPPGYSGVEQVFEPHRSSVPQLGPYLASLWERRRFMVELAKANVRGKRSSTVLGSLWGVLDPLFAAAIYYLLFTIIREGSRPIDFLHILVAGIFMFQLVTSALTEGGSSIRQSKGLMLNSAFPRALLPIASVYQGILKFLPTIGVYVLIHVALQAPVGWGLLLLPLLFALQTVLMVGFALFTSTLVVFFNDVTNLLRYVTRLLLFTSPIIFPLASIPDGIRSVLAWQPLFPLFASYQEIFGGDVPDPTMILQIAAWAFGFLLVGGWLFLRHERDFASKL